MRLDRSSKETRPDEALERAVFLHNCSVEAVACTAIYYTNSQFILQQGLVLRRFALRRFTFTTLVQSDRALPDLWCVTVATQASFLYLVRFQFFSGVPCVSAFSILVQFLQADCDFSTHDLHKKEQKRRKNYNS